VIQRRITSPPEATLDFGTIRSELGVHADFPADVVAAAHAAAAAGPTDPAGTKRRDATDLELVTIDPPGSMDLDQAVALEPRGDGWRVSYAIADVAAWVSPGGSVDLEARARTQTMYAPDTRVPLHPPALGEAAASLLPDGPRPAVLWTIDVAGDGSIGSIDVERATVRSRARLDYEHVQQQLDAGTTPEVLRAFPAVGAALTADARRRGAIELGLPEQEVVPAANGTWTIHLRADRPVEQWNAQISLLTGRAAATLMLQAGIGILRTLPAPDPAQFPRLQRAAHNLGIAWSDGESPGAVLASLDTSNPKHAAFADLAAELLRGAGYTALAGAAPADPGHAGVGAPYAHVTAPLRRLVDRFGTEACLAIAAGAEVPEWVTEALPTLPEAMAAGDHLAHQLDRAVVDATEAFVLERRIGEVFPATVMETGDRYGTVALTDPAIRARCDARGLPLGGDVGVRCTEADVAKRTVRFERVS
jgi:exoribonuclease R